jgi:polyadenylate-binding protein
VTRRSLGYAYVNYQDSAAAEAAINTLNFSDIRGKQCRVCWVQRDATVRRSGLGNLYVAKLPEDIDNKGLYDAFAKYGNVVSSKVCTHRETGKALGYGFVQFESDDVARTVVDKSPIMVGENQVVVTPYKLRKDRSTANTAFTNVYVKNLPDSWSKEDMDRHFGQYGNINSSVLNKSSATGSEGLAFGFINFDNHEEAQNAVEKAGTVEVDGKKIYAVRALSKAERERQKRDAMDARRAEHQQKFASCNLYVKFLPAEVSDEAVKDVFSKYGTIVSFRVARNEDGSATGVAFICYAGADEATKAITELNQSTVFGKPIFVTLHQSKMMRAQQRNAELWGHPMRGGQGYFHPGMVMVPQHYGKQQQFYGGGMRPVHGGPYMHGPMGYMGNMRGRVPRNGPHGGPMGGPMGGRGPRQPRAQGQNSRRPRPQPQQSGPAFDPSVFATMPPELQRNYLGELLFPKVSAVNAEQAPKITGMLIEMDATEVIKLLHSEEELVAKVNEAIDVLRDANEGTA